MEDKFEKAPDDALPALCIDASFFSPDAGGLDYPEALRSKALLERLSHTVAQQPANLTAHVRRIRLAAALDDEASLSGALADLFIALGDKGGALRARALHSWAAGLPASLREMFEQALEAGMDAHTRLPLRCRLTAGCMGRSDFVEPIEDISAPADERRAALDTARDLIDCGQLDEACSLLEQWLPGADETLWEEGAMELMRLYRYIDGGEERALACEAALWAKRPACAQVWAALKMGGSRP